MERYIAIDGVCAWPNLTRLPDGTIVATIFNQPCHGLWEGDVEAWASEDGGRTWGLRGTPAVHEPGTNRMNVAAGLSAGGDLVVLASGWSHRPRRGEGTAGHGSPAYPLPPWICRSRDGGRTWTHEHVVPPPGGESPNDSPQSSPRIIPFGDIVQLPDGSLGACLYSWRPPDERGCHFYTSSDDGYTWSVRGPIQVGDVNETTPIVLPDGELLACGRTTGDQHLELFRSIDAGASWQREQQVSQGAQHPGHLLALPDGRILLTCGDRREGRHGIEVRLSDDGGRTWGDPRRLVDLDPGDLGYPSTVPGEEGTLVTAWYSAGVAVHERYHMGVAIWRCEEQFARVGA